jgi:hypothetical protein
MPYHTVGLVVFVTLGMLMAPWVCAAQPPKPVVGVGILFSQHPPLAATPRSHLLSSALPTPVRGMEPS